MMMRARRLASARVGPAAPRPCRRVQAAAEADTEGAASPTTVADTAAPQQQAKVADTKVKNIASTFAPRASGNTGKNPAVRGSTLYNIFTVQAWVCMAFGGLLSFNLLFPSDEPDLWRLMGMWSVWMFTIPSLRARECTDAEKDWLNYAFIAVPLVNVALPFVWKSFAFVYSADAVALAAIYYWKVAAREQSGTPQV